MKKSDIMQLRNYIEPVVTQYGQKLNMYFTNRKPYGRKTEDVILQDSSPENLLKLRKHLNSAHCQYAKVEDKNVVAAMSYVVTLGDMFMMNAASKNKRSDKEMFDHFNQSLVSRIDPTDFMEQTFQIKGKNDEFALQFEQSSNFKRMPEEQQTELLNTVLRTCRHIDKLSSPAQGKDV